MIEFLIIPEDIAYSDLRPTEKLLYGYIANRSNSCRYVEIPESIPEICKLCGYKTAGEAVEAVQILREKELADFRSIDIEDEEEGRHCVIALVPLDPNWRP